MSERPTLSYQCPFCPIYFTPTLKSWLGHIRLVHQSDPRIPCCIDLCKETFCKYNSLKSHMYRRHRDHINGDVKQKESVEVPTVADDIEPTADSSTPIHSAEADNFITAPDSSTPISITHNDLDTDHMDHSGTLQVETSNQGALSSDETQSIIDRNVAMYLLKLKEVHRLSQAAIDCVISGTRSLLDQHLATVKGEVDLHLQQSQLQGAEDIRTGVSRIFEDVHDPFARLNSAYMQEKYFRDKFHLVDPTEIKLGDCYDSQGYGEKRTKVIGYDSFQYVPLFDSLTSLLKDQSVYDEILNARNTSPSSDLLSDFCDGSLFKTHPIFSTDPHALQIILYYDELEIVNPIGCFVKQHKIGCVMFSLGNVHPKFRSSLKAMYLVAIATAPIIEKYGIDRILQPFVRDINKITESGITVNVDGTDRTFRGALLAIIADTLASHQLGGFKGSMSWALRICRTCMATKDTTRSNFVEESFELRTPAKHAIQCDSLQLEDSARNSTKYGINRKSILEDVKHFSVAGRTLAHDFMHDILEGVLPLEIKALLKYLFSENLIKLELINLRLQSFAFGYSEVGSKPVLLTTATFDHDGKIKQSASRMLVLARVLPFLIGDKIPEECDQWECYLMLLDIIEIAMSPKISISTVSYLRVLIEEHHLKFIDLYPHLNVIPKMHYMVHYPSQILTLGPLIRCWTMRHEAKLSLLKQSGLRSNFKNVAQTVAKRHQGWLCYYNQAALHTSCIDVPSGVKVGFLKDEPTNMIQGILEKAKTIRMDSTLARPSWIKFNGSEFRTIDCFVILSVDEYKQPSFAKIIDMYLIDDNIVIFLAQIYTTLYYYRHFHSYVIEATADLKLVKLDELKDHTSYHMRTAFLRENLSLVCLKYHLEPDCVS